MRTYPCQKKTDFRPVFEHILNRQSRLEKPPCLGPSVPPELNPVVTLFRHHPITGPGTEDWTKWQPKIGSVSDAA